MHGRVRHLRVIILVATFADLGSDLNNALNSDNPSRCTDLSGDNLSRKIGPRQGSLRVRRASVRDALPSANMQPAPWNLMFFMPGRHDLLFLGFWRMSVAVASKW